jgi:hypothetical protein
VSPDPQLRRIERTALIWCAAAAAVAVVLDPSRPRVAAGVLGGGALVGLSYWAIRSSITTLVEGMMKAPAAASDRGAPRDPAVGLRPAKLTTAIGRFVGRYALLGFLAYVMIARLRLHPLGLLIGASSIVAATAIEAVRQQGRA